MKNSTLILLLFTFSYSLFADTIITRGSDVGEIYFIGPTATGPEAIYHSTDFGETATCMDSTFNSEFGTITKISADLTSGVLYGSTMGQALYISFDYGIGDSWTLQNGGVSLNLLSGRREGYIYNGFAEHSDDYGLNFIEHTYNGYFGSIKTSEIDVQEDVGYTLVRNISINDSLWLLISYDDFENFEVQYSFNWNSNFDYFLSRGSVLSELYIMKSTNYGDGSMSYELWFSNDFGDNWNFKNYLLSNKIVGGRQPGELFVLANYRQLMGEIAHTFIYHSLDYGETFTVYHPFSYGEEPYYSDFEADITEGSAPLTVQFTDLSGGDIQTWEWDFDLDRIVDSYEQNPEYAYQDTGFYSVKLRIYGSIYEDGYIKTDYIHVTDGSSAENYDLEMTSYKLNNYPNPFNPTTTISFNTSCEDTENLKVEIYNLKGQKVVSLPIYSSTHSPINSVIWNAEEFTSGLYFYKLNIDNSPIKKMVLLK